MTEIVRVTGTILLGPQEEVGELWIVGGRVTFERPSGGETTTVTGWALPGLVDAHSHIGLAKGSGPADRAETEAQARADRDAGALLIRDAGSPIDTRWIDEVEDLPRIVRAGQHIARARRYIRGIGSEIEPDELVAQVRYEARRGGGWVKLVGDWIDRDSGDLSPCWPAEAVAAAVAAAHEEGARVTAHCFGEQSLVDFAAAGTDCIEHATGLTEDTIASFASQSIVIVPTLVNIANFPAFADAAGEKFPLYAAHMRDLHARRYATVAAAHEAGIPVRVGTDAGTAMPHGLIVSEVAELATAGLTPVEALDAGCWAARAWLGHPGLTEGAPADLVLLDADPRTDLAALRHPAAIVLRGRIVG